MLILLTLILGIAGLGTGIWLSRPTAIAEETQGPADGLVEFINQGVHQLGKDHLKNSLQFLAAVLVTVIGIKICLGEAPNIGVPIMVVTGVGIAWLNMRFMTQISAKGLSRIYAAIQKDDHAVRHELTRLCVTVGCFVMGALLTVLSILIGVLCMILSRHTGLSTTLEIEMIVISMALTLGTTLFVAFIRLATSIYAKVTDLTADSVGRTEYDLMEDDLRNPGSIPDMVGDLLSKGVGMGLLVYECILFCVVSCVVMSLITIDEFHLLKITTIIRMLSQPVLILLIGGVISCGVMAIQKKITQTLSISKMILITYGLLVFCVGLLEILGMMSANMTILVISGCGLGIAITLNNQSAVSKQSLFVKKVITAFDSGAVSGFLRGLLYAIVASMVPILGVAALISITFTVSGGFQSLLQGFHALSLSLIAMLSPGPLLISLGVVGGISDNVHGISEMVMDEESIKKRAKELDIEGTENLSLVKTLTIVAGMTSCLILMMFFIKRMMVAITTHFAHDGMIKVKDINVSHTLNMGTETISIQDLTVQKLIHILDLSILHPDVILGVFIGSLIIVVVSGALIIAVQSGIEHMTADIRAQMSSKPGIWTGETLPDYHLVIESVNQKTVRWVKLILAGAVVIPILALLTIELDGVLGMILGMTTTGIIVSLVANYAGGIWQMAKKVIEVEDPNYGTSSRHLSSVFVDGIGDVLKDTIAPSLYMVIKIIGIISLMAGAIVLYV